MRAVFILVLTCNALGATSDPIAIGMTGTWTTSDKKTREDAKKLLVHSSYADKVHMRVCYTEVTSLEKQVVAGINYRFHIVGCNVTDSDGEYSVGECSESTLSSCVPQRYVVQIFEQAWTNTLKVTSITPEESSISFSSLDDEDSSGEQNMSEEEKKAVDEWIQFNGLNKFGDAATRMYAGGTPLFDEKTGTTKDRYEYIVSRHPDLPWQANEVLAVNYAEEALDETKGQGSVFGFISMLSVFTVVLTGVAIIKRRQGNRDRFSYHPIRTREQ